MRAFHDHARRRRPHNWSFFETKRSTGLRRDIATNRAGAAYLPDHFLHVQQHRHAAALCLALPRPGNIYTLINETRPRTSSSSRIAARRAASAALFLASCQASEHFATSTSPLRRHIVSSPRLYGGTYNLFHYTLPPIVIESLR